METAQTLTGNCPVFTWDGVDWLTIPNAADLKRNLSIGGFSIDFNLILFATADQFAQAGYATADAVAEAMLDTPLQYLGENFKVESVKVLTGATIIVIGCNALDQGA